VQWILAVSNFEEFEFFSKELEAYKEVLPEILASPYLTILICQEIL